MPYRSAAATEYKNVIARALKGPSNLPVREFVEFGRLIARPDIWARIQEYRPIPSLHE